MKTAAALCILIALTAAPAAARTDEPWMPVAVGNTWAYDGDMTGPDVKRLEYQHAEGFWAVVYVQSDHSPGLENYWSTNADGDVLLHGYRRLDPRQALFYDPPYTLVDAPLHLGKTWVCTVGMSETPGGPIVNTISVRYTVTDVEVRTVGDETFTAYGVTESGATPDDDARAAYRPDGTPRPAAKGDTFPWHWWSPGIGEVGYRALGLFTLSSYSLAPAGAETSSWSRIKATFR